MVRLAHRMLSGCMVATVLWAVGLMLGPAASTGMAGTITAGLVNLVNPLGTSKAGATLGTVSLGGDIGTAQAFLFTNVGNPSTLSSPSTGYFYGLSALDISFASVSFEFTSNGTNTTASFSSPLFGSFQSNYAIQVANTDNGSQKTRVFDVYGTYTSGTISQLSFPSEVGPRGNTSPYPVNAVWEITLNQQAGGAGQAINFTSTLSFPVAVPEPGTSTLALVGFAALAAGYVARHRGRVQPKPPSS